MMQMAFYELLQKTRMAVNGSDVCAIQIQTYLYHQENMFITLKLLIMQRVASSLWGRVKGDTRGKV